MEKIQLTAHAPLQIMPAAPRSYVIFRGENGLYVSLVVAWCIATMEYGLLRETTRVCPLVQDGKFLSPAEAVGEVEGSIVDGWYDMSNNQGFDDRFRAEDSDDNPAFAQALAEMAAWTQDDANQPETKDGK